MRYWWRAQSTAYLMRLNERTVSRVAELRWNISMMQYFPPHAHHHPLHSRTQQTLPPGSISAHVREGDKGKELVNQKLPNISAYLAAAKRILRANPLGTSRLIFLSSENPENLNALRDFTASPEGHAGVRTTWYGLATAMPRHNSNGYSQGTLYGTEFMMVRYLLQLLLALECDAFIGQRASNWNTVIDQLRCVWVPKCAATFTEVGEVNFDQPNTGLRFDDSFSMGAPFFGGWLGWR